MRHATPDGVVRVLNARPMRPSMRRLRLVLDNKPESSLPQSKDLSAEFPDPFDQGELGSCYENALIGLYCHQLFKTNYKYKFIPSRLFMYYNARSIMGTVDSDSGTDPDSGIKALNEFGVCPEQELDGTSPNWILPYDISKFTQKPSDACYKDAVLHKVVKDHSVNLDRLTVLNALAAGIPFGVGFTVNQSFMSQQMADTGIMHIANPFDPMDPEIGGHEVAVIGYALNKPMGNQGVKDWALVRNSWGTSFGCAAATGVRGYFFMPLEQVLCNSNIAGSAQAIDLTSEAH